MKKEESNLTTTKAFLLCSLEQEPKHGYELMREFKKNSGHSLSAGQIYPLFDKMTKQGFLEVRVEYEGKRARKIYNLTEKGIEESKRIKQIHKKLLYL